ncbi:MAG: UvrD-helicase domain-containing protein [Bacteroidales bacterium]|nr:UvrD-helicase domain-containing protein [Bacteroidales bacterium]
MERPPFLIYKASAGAGKTYTLVKEYLKMVFAGGEERLAANFKSVLAITFTNKAAAEMKGRIIDELHELATSPITPQSKGLGADLLRELASDWPHLHKGQTLDGEMLRHMASRLYSIALHSYSDLSVSTIDSFTHRVVRAFAHDLGCPLNFNVVVDRKEITLQAVSQLMSLVGTEGEEQLTTLLTHFAENEMEDGSDYKIEKKITGLAEQLFREEADTHLQNLSKLSAKDFLSIHRSYANAFNQAKIQLKKLGCDMISLLNSVGIDEFNSYYGNTGYYGHLIHLTQDNFKAPSTRTLTSIRDGVLVKPTSGKALLAAAASVSTRIQTMFEESQSLLVQIHTYEALLKHLYSVAVLGSLGEQMHLYASDNEMVHLSDFNKMINKIVEDEDNPAPFIYERLGSRYRHFLIDEFQDTSILQWHNLVPLLENGVSQGAMSMVVGDGKQSIYRFRQGDVRQFVRLPQVEGMRHHGQVLSREGSSQVVNLDSNYRSAAPIVDFNNEFFSHLARTVYAGNPVVQEIYIGLTPDGSLRPAGEEELRQKAVKGPRGYVKVEFVGDSEKGDEEEDAADDSINSRILQTIRHLVDERGYAYKDIAILTRSNNELAEIGTYLMEEGKVPQTSTESFRLRESQAVMAIIAVMRLTFNADDRVAEADLIHRLAALGIISPEALLTACDSWASTPRNATHPDHPASEALASAGIRLNLGYLAALGLYDCCEAIIRTLHIDGVDVPYVSSLLNEVASFTTNYHHEMADFIDWFDSQEKLSASLPEGINAVQMLTIHKAKGLGKPVIICPLKKGKVHSTETWVNVASNPSCASLKPSTSSSTPNLPSAYVSLKKDITTHFDPIFQQDQLMAEVDELNVLYVAFTRPQERLYVFSPEPSKSKSKQAPSKDYPSLLACFAPDGYESGDEVAMHLDATETTSLKEVTNIGRISFPDWSERVSVASPSEKALTQVLEQKARFGTYVHTLLSHINSAADIEPALADLTREANIAETDREVIAEIAHRVVSHPDAARFFNPACQIKNECDLAVEGKLLRPDRIMLLDSETWVIDFKTGDPSPDHHRQVAEYCTAIERMQLPNVSGFIVYLQPSIRIETCLR